MWRSHDLGPAGILRFCGVVRCHCIRLAQGHGGVKHAGGKEMAAPKLTREELDRAPARRIPRSRPMPWAITRSRRCGTAVAGCAGAHHEKSLRPGGTVSGPIMMALADFTMYLAVLSAIGWVPLAVTTNLTINFLKKPAPRDLLAEARLIKLGKRLAVGEVGIRVRRRRRPRRPCHLDLLDTRQRPLKVIIIPLHQAIEKYAK